MPSLRDLQPEIRCVEEVLIDKIYQKRLLAYQDTPKKEYLQKEVEYIRIRYNALCGHPKHKSVYPSWKINSFWNSFKERRSEKFVNLRYEAERLLGAIERDNARVTPGGFDHY